MHFRGCAHPTAREPVLPQAELAGLIHDAGMQPGGHLGDVRGCPPPMPPGSISPFRVAAFYASKNSL